MIPVFKEALAAHMIFMAVGVKPDDIYVTIGAVDPRGNKDQLAVIVKQGDEYIYTVTVGPYLGSREEFEREWPLAVAELKKLSKREAVAFRDATHIRHHATEIMLGLKAKQAAAAQR